jgi:hypothetical protein
MAFASSLIAEDAGSYWPALKSPTVHLYTIYEASVHGFSVSCAKQYEGYISIQNDMSEQCASCIVGTSAYRMTWCIVHLISSSHLMMLTAMRGMRRH